MLGTRPLIAATSTCIFSAYAELSAGFSPHPFWEPRLQDYYEPLRDYTPPPPKFWEQTDFRPLGQVVRMTHMTDEQFQTLVRKGQPFVVNDCTTGFPYMNWTCADFSKAWPKGNMKAEYSEGQARTRLGDKKWYTESRPAMGNKQHLSQGKKIAGPYIWHVKDEEPLKTKQSVQKNWQTPYFLNHTAVNRLEAWDSFEMWFSMPDGGAFAHSDSYNEMTISAQFRGVKTWRLGMYPELPTVFDSFNSFDAGVYKIGKWAPEYEFEVGPGQCFIFPPTYLHETYVKPEQNNECTIATTFQYNVPFPAKYVRTWLPRLMNSHLVWAESALELWAPYLQVIQEKVAKPVLEDKMIKSRVDKVFEAVDAKKDGVLTLADLEAFYLNHPKAKFASNKEFSWHRHVSKAQKKEAAVDLAKSRAGDVLAWHDLDEDGRVMPAEMLETMRNWNIMLSRYNRLKALKKNMKKKSSKDEAKKIEVEFWETYGGCKSENATLSDTCKSFVETLKERKVPSLYRIQAFTEEDDNEEQGGKDEL